VKDDYGNTLHEGEKVKFFYGIPPTKAVGAIAIVKGRWWVESESGGMTLADVKRYFGVEVVDEN